MQSIIHTSRITGEYARIGSPDDITTWSKVRSCPSTGKKPRAWAREIASSRTRSIDCPTILVSGTKGSWEIVAQPRISGNISPSIDFLSSFCAVIFLLNVGAPHSGASEIPGLTMPLVRLCPISRCGSGSQIHLLSGVPIATKQSHLSTTIERRDRRASLAMAFRFR